MRIRRPSRLHAFLLASALLVATVVVVAGLLLGRFVEARVLAREVGYLVDDVRHHAREDLGPTAFEPASPQARASAFDQFFGDLREVFRVKVWDPNGRIIWSNEPRLIGMAFPDNPHLSSALGGQVTTVFGSPKERENVYEGAHRSVVEVYVPIIFPGNARIIGVIETYKDMTEIFLRIQRVQRRFWMVGGAMGLLLYVSLGVVAWMASAGEQRAISRVEKQNRELREIEERLRQTNRALLDTQAQLVKKERLAAVGQVIVGLHHTILNPLTGILGVLQVLKQNSLDPLQEARAIAEAEEQAREIEQVVKRLRNLQRADGTGYLGDTKMLDLEASSEEEEAPSVAGRRPGPDPAGPVYPK